MCLVASHAGPLFLASGHPPTPPLPQVDAGRLWGAFTWAGGWEGGVWCPAAHLPCPRASSCPTVGRVPTLPGAGHGGPASPPGPAPLPFPLGVFSEPATFLQGFTRDPPHPQLGGSRCLLPAPLPGRRHPMSSAFENPDKGPARPREPSQGLRGAGAQTSLLRSPHLFICSWGPRGACGPAHSRP